jgi:hypothetical protein
MFVPQRAVEHGLDGATSQVSVAPWDSTTDFRGGEIGDGEFGPVF